MGEQKRFSGWALKVQNGETKQLRGPDILPINQGFLGVERMQEAEKPKLIK